MSSRIVVVHDDAVALAEFARTLQGCGHQAVTFGAPLPAWNLISQAASISALVTQIRFAKGGPNGVALGRWTQLNHPAAHVFFIGPLEMAEFIEGAGMLFSPDLPPSDTATEIAQILVSGNGYRPVVPRNLVH